ncbi:MAG: site-specific DNA-methyltransferase [Pseudomonadota bacterium]
MEKLKLHSPDLTQANIDKLAALFPDCVAEAADANGVIKRSIDFDRLRQELSGSIVEGPPERYQLNWPGKREALLTANAPVAKTLRPCRDESVNFDATQNLFIEGDNLDALKLLQETYLNKVKVIYIDPPYNTGNDFIYNDDFSESTESYLQRSSQLDTQRNRLIANTASNGRFHSDWLTMIYTRLKLARNLLSEDGVLFVSIGDDELENTLKLTKEIFGEDNFVTTFLWQKKKKPSFLHANVGSMYEYVVCVARNRAAAPSFSVDVTTAGKKYPLNNAGNSLGVLVFPPHSVRFSEYSAIYKPQDMSDGNIVTRLLDHIDVVEHTNLQAFRLEGEFRYSQARVNEILAAGELITISKAPFRPNHVKVGGEMKKMHNLLTQETYGVGTNEDGSSELTTLFGSSLFDNPKPSSLIRLLCQAVTHDDAQALVMDFFAGSGSTADAVMQLNVQDGGRRRFILVQLPEPCEEKSEAFRKGYKFISEITKERIRRVGTSISQHRTSGSADSDTGFRVLKVDTSNMANVHYAPDALDQDAMNLFIDNIKHDRSAEDLLFQVMLDWGLDLSLPIEKKNVRGKDVYLVDGDVIAACFDAQGGVDEDFAKELAKYRPLRAIFRDAGLESSAVKINIEQIFKQLSPSTEIKVL